MATILFFRDNLVIDSSLFARMQSLKMTPSEGDTLVLGAAQCTLSELTSGYQYIILADTLTPTGPIGLTAFAGIGDSIGIYANTISAALTITYQGHPGPDGDAGVAGEDGDIVIEPPNKPIRLPGGPGGNGGNGGKGGNGGAVTICYASAPSVPVATAPGGAGGGGGAGGPGGAGKPPGRPGHGGRPGPAGQAGAIQIAQANPGRVFAGLNSSWLGGWSDYRTSVGEYQFRRFDAGSQLAALKEFDAALELNPANARAATLRTRIIQQETPSGVPRDLDMAPDYRDVAAGLLGETQLVLSDFLALQGSATQGEIAAATRDQFAFLLSQLSDRLTESNLDLVSAKAGVQVADADWQSYDTQITALQQQIIDLQNQKMSLGDLVTTLGAVVGGIAGLATGVGAIIDIPAALAVNSQAEAGVIGLLLAKITGQPTGDSKKLGGDLTDLLKGGQDAVTNFSKVYSELAQSNNAAPLKQLAQQVATLTLQQMVAQLRRQQSNDTLAAAQARVSDYTTEVQNASTLLNSWAADADFFANAVGVMIGIARALADIVAEDIFIARRALEIYQLQDASTARFDYGWLHPDQDNDLVLYPLRRAQLCLQSVTLLPKDVITWNNIYVGLNESLTSGFDVIHPNVEVTISDPAALAAFASGGDLRFSIGIGPYAIPTGLPDDIYELKVNALTLELDGASATTAARIWIEHTGHWIMNKPPTVADPAPLPAEFTLFRHVEIFNIEAGSSRLISQIPDQPPSSIAPGPPFSFWGRGALADWRLFTDSSIGALNLTSLSGVKLTFGCIGLVPQGVAMPSIPGIGASTAQTLPSLETVRT